MKVEEGKFYKTRDGEKVGPFKWRDDCLDFVPAFYAVDTRYEGSWWSRTGACGYLGEGVGAEGRSVADLISEWVDEPALPIRTRTVTEIVPGVYGRVEISPYASTAVTHVGVRMEPMSGSFAALDAAELRAAARIFVSLAEALEEQG